MKRTSIPSLSQPEKSDLPMPRGCLLSIALLAGALAQNPCPAATVSPIAENLSVYLGFGFTTSEDPAPKVACLGMNPDGHALAIGISGVPTWVTPDRLQHRPGASLPISGHHLAFAPDGSFFVLGKTNTTFTADGMTWNLAGRFVAKFNAARRPLWAAKLRDDPVDDLPTVGTPTPDGGFVAAATIQGSTLLTAFDPEGSARWSQRLTNLVVGAVSATPNGSLHLAATFTSSAVWGTASLTSRGAEDIAVAQLTPTGAIRWVQHVGGPLMDQIVGIGADGEGNAVLATRFTRRTTVQDRSVTANGGAGIDIGLIGFTTDGTLRWLRAEGGMEDDAASHLVVDDDGNSYLLRNRPERPTETATTQVIKHDSSGVPVWSRAAPMYQSPSPDRLPLVNLVGDRSGNLVAIALRTIERAGLFRGVIQEIEPVALPILTTNPERVEEMELSLARYTGLKIAGRPGRTYRIEFRLDMSQPWTAIDEVTLPSPSHVWFDPESSRRSHGFYRLVLLP